MPRQPSLPLSSSVLARRATRAVLLCASLLLATNAAAQGKKVYISVDMEGISGVNGDDQTGPGGAEYGRARKLMAEDANAAIRGAFEGGATDVLVNDSHGGQRNLLPEDLDPRARLISHSFKRYGMMEGLDDTFDAVIFVGYHAKADAPRGVFAHTGSGVVRDLQVNGRSVGEGGMNAALAAWFGVPVVSVSGDDVAVEEVKASVPAIRTVAVKRAINGRAVELRPLVDARRDIQAAARDGVKAATKTKPERVPAYQVRMQFRNYFIPEVADAFEEMTLVAPDTVQFSRPTMPEAYRLIRVLYRFINTN
ncbi:MAG: M55 family metallopeptidase [Acidobacteria bacterium]|nr:M55 family metallopeptidase [Acidobacteriota bacterium]